MCDTSSTMVVADQTLVARAVVSQFAIKSELDGNFFLLFEVAPTNFFSLSLNGGGLALCYGSTDVTKMRGYTLMVSGWWPTLHQVDGGRGEVKTVAEGGLQYLDRT